MQMLPVPISDDHLSWFGGTINTRPALLAFCPRPFPGVWQSSIPILQHGCQSLIDRSQRFPVCLVLKLFCASENDLFIRRPHEPGNTPYFDLYPGKADCSIQERANLNGLLRAKIIGLPVLSFDSRQIESSNRVTHI